MTEEEKLEQIREKALQLGFKTAKLIPADQVVVENRVALKCRVGCDDYGRKMTCPPYVPSVDAFRAMLREYHWALLVKFQSQAHLTGKVARGLLRCEYDPTIDPADKEKATQFWSVWKSQKKDILLVVLELEKTAFNLGFTFALGFTSGSCGLCQTCHPQQGICAHPTIARLPEHAVGINMKQTMANAGLPLAFPFNKTPEPTSLLLID